MADLHARLVAALQARLEVARAATPGPWQTSGPDTVGQWVIYDDQWAVAEVRAYSHNEPMSNKPGARGPAYIDSDANAAFIATNDPATVIRQTEAKLRVVERHLHTQHRVWGPRYDPDTGELRDAEVDIECTVCGYVDGTCPDLRDLAAGEGIEVET